MPKKPKTARKTTGPKPQIAAAEMFAAAARENNSGLTVYGWQAAELPFNAAETLDVEIARALRPGLASVPGSLLLFISSPYARRGLMYQAFTKHYGREGDPVLVWRAATRDMNPTIPQDVIDEALAEDEPAAPAEFLAEFRSDVEALLTREAVERCIEPGRHELPPLDRVTYQAFVDPSGGSSDSMTLAVAHRDGEVAVLDCLRERRPPFSPEAVVREFCETLKTYRVHKVVGDRYGASWVSERFQKEGIRYEPAEKAKSEIYLELLPALNSGRVQLLDNAKLVSQLVGLERRTARGGRESIDHAPGAHDDLANAAAGAVQFALGKKRGIGWSDLYPERAARFGSDASDLPRGIVS